MRMPLYLTGFTQVFFVAINTYFLAQANFIGVAFASFAISFVWSHNVKKVAFGSLRDRVIYSLGAASGALAGLALAVKF
jgi:hypothetical protein